MPSIEENLAVYSSQGVFPSHGDGWTNQAEYCGVNYELWKAELFDEFAKPFILSDGLVLEIGPGHGRWSQLLAPLVPQGRCILVDLSPACIDYCRSRLYSFGNVTYMVNNGYSLPFLPTGSIDFIWSYDTFVHIEEPETRSYFLEFRRVLKLGARGCIHHPGTPTAEQRSAGWRSMVTAAVVRKIAQESELKVMRQTDSWGPNGMCNTKLHSDIITEFTRIN
jgi:Methylase involved in ubiquinone/menaquinone biosynthesis